MKLYILSLVQVVALAASPDARLDSMILKEDWRGLGGYVASDKGLARSAEGRLLNAHASLALNDNNAAFCGFSGVTTDQELATWERWTAELMERAPEFPIAHYLHGDALARLQKWDAALEELTRALAIKQDYFLALNARGVVHTIVGRYDAGLLDFVSAVATNRSFVDAYINRGFSYIQRKGSASSEIRVFDSALVLNPRATLAILGRSQALVATGLGITGISEIDGAPKPCRSIQSITEADRHDLFAWVQRSDAVLLARGAGKDDAGTTLNSLLKDLAQNRDAASAKKVIDFAAASKDPDVQKKTTLTFQSMEKTDTGMGAVIGKALNEKKIENETLHSNLLKQGSEKVSTEADAGLGIKKAGLTIGATTKATVSGDLKAYADQQLKDLAQTDGFTKQLDSQLMSGKAQSGGAETALIGVAQIEHGNAPHIFHNGLLYQSLAPKKEARQ